LYIPANVSLPVPGKSPEQKQKSLQVQELAGFLGLVGGAGFEPATPAV
jgi:hypothetical protein